MHSGVKAIILSSERRKHQTKSALGGEHFVTSLTVWKLNVFAYKLIRHTQLYNNQ
jgi:hypothetical protein